MTTSTAERFVGLNPTHDIERIRQSLAAATRVAIAPFAVSAIGNRWFTLWYERNEPSWVEFADGSWARFEVPTTKREAALALELHTYRVWIVGRGSSLDCQLMPRL